MIFDFAARQSALTFAGSSEVLGQILIHWEFQPYFVPRRLQCNIVENNNWRVRQQNESRLADGRLASWSVVDACWPVRLIILADRIGADTRKVGIGEAG